MKSERAVELVKEYSFLNTKIKDLTKKISDSIVQCEGISGQRLTSNLSGETDSRGREKDLHLTSWYTCTGVSEEDGYTPVYENYPDESECQHCWDAHNLIQERKLAKKRFGTVKGTITRMGEK